MSPLHQLILWSVVGLVGGGFIGSPLTRQCGALDVVRNLALGFAGAVIGGWLFGLFDLLPAVSKVAVFARDVAAAVIGSLTVVMALCVMRPEKSPQSRRAALRDAPITSPPAGSATDRS